MSSEDGNVGGIITINGSAANWSGTITNDLTGETADLSNILLDGETLDFNFNLPELGTISVSVVISEDSFNGDVTVEGIGTMPISGSRTSGPESTHQK